MRRNDSKASHRGSRRGARARCHQASTTARNEALTCLVDTAQQHQKEAREAEDLELSLWSILGGLARVCTCARSRSQSSSPWILRETGGRNQHKDEDCEELRLPLTKEVGAQCGISSAARERVRGSGMNAVFE